MGDFARAMKKGISEANKANRKSSKRRNMEPSNFETFFQMFLTIVVFIFLLIHFF